ncbi:hypothetical protein MY10362_008351 [Beauveria mimosiformis]
MLSNVGRAGILPTLELMGAMLPVAGRIRE